MLGSEQSKKPRATADKLDGLAMNRCKRGARLETVQSGLGILGAAIFLDLADWH